MYRTLRVVSVIVVLLLIFFGVGTLSTLAEGELRNGATSLVSHQW